MTPDSMEAKGFGDRAWAGITDVSSLASPDFDDCLASIGCIDVLEGDPAPDDVVKALDYHAR